MTSAVSTSPAPPRGGRDLKSAVLVGAGLLAKKAVEKGLTVDPHVKTSLAPGSKVVTEYLQTADVLPALCHKTQCAAFYIV